jgi:hypothetical protein
LTKLLRLHYHGRMIETFSFLFGLGFSVLVTIRSIKPGNHPPVRKMIYAITSTIGITGMVWLSGVLVAHFLRKLGLY